MLHNNKEVKMIKNIMEIDTEKINSLKAAVRRLEEKPHDIIEIKNHDTEMLQFRFNGKPFYLLPEGQFLGRVGQLNLIQDVCFTVYGKIYHDYDEPTNDDLIKYIKVNEARWQKEDLTFPGWLEEVTLHGGNTDNTDEMHVWYDEGLEPDEAAIKSNQYELCLE